MDAVKISRDLGRRASRLRFGAPVTHVYNPLVYARHPHEVYLERYARPGCEVLLLGMNPGPFGMAQTGVPFGEVEAVRGWLRIEAVVGKPAREHPRRPVDGFACARREVSGQRLWGWARERFDTPERFFARFFVWNYCPLVFLEESGRNRTPDKLPAREREPLTALCDEALRRIIGYLRPEALVGIGRFALERAKGALVGEDGDLVRGSIPHPSPASPLANRGWAKLADEALRELGIASGGGRRRRGGRRAKA